MGRLGGKANWSEALWTAVALTLLWVAGNLIVLAVELSGGEVSEVGALVHRAMHVAVALIGTPIVVRQLRDLGIRRDGFTMLLLAGAVSLVLLVLFKVLGWLGATAGVLLTVVVVSALARRKQLTHDDESAGGRR